MIESSYKASARRITIGKLGNKERIDIMNRKKGMIDLHRIYK